MCNKELVESLVFQVFDFRSCYPSIRAKATALGAGQTIPRLSLELLDRDLGAALTGMGQVLDAAVDDSPNPLQELDP